MPIFVVALASICLSVAAQFCLKAGTAVQPEGKGRNDGFSLQGLFDLLTNGFTVLGFVLYGLGAVVWLAVLSKWDVSKAYPLVGLGFVLTTATGLMMGEQISLTRVSGVVLICGGVYLITRT